MKFFTLNYKMHEINFMTCRLVAVQNIIISMSILRFLKPIDGISVQNGQLLSLVPSTAIRGSTLGFQVLKFNKTKSIEYPSSEVAFEVIV